MLMAAKLEQDDSRARIMDASRRLFGRRGFHSTPMADLAVAARVSVGQIYRLFPGKDDIIVAIVEEDARTHINGLEDIFASAENGGISLARAIELFAFHSLSKAHPGLSFEILAESYRNPRVAEVVERLSSRYRDLIRRLASHARPALDAADLDACVEIMNACFHGFAIRASQRHRIDPAELSRAAACLILRGVGAAEA
jgi:TetR/AcrR family transcriptional repressor of uid operon